MEETLLQTYEVVKSNKFALQQEAKMLEEKQAACNHPEPHQYYQGRYGPRDWYTCRVCGKEYGV